MDLVVAAAHAPSLIVGITKEVRGMVKGDRALQRKLDDALQYIDYELGLLRGLIREEMSKSNNNNNQGHRKPQKGILELQELVYDIEDFKAEHSRDGKTSAAWTPFLIGDPRREHIFRAEKLKERIRDVTDPSRRASYPPPPPPPTPPRRLPQHPSLSWAGRCSVCPPAAAARDGDVVRMEQPMKELVELLPAAAGGGHDEGERKVISIVGCAGVGKTTLAKALLRDAVVQDRFPRRAWVDAPPSPDQVPRVLQRLDRHFRHCQRSPHRHCQRYLVVVDGVQQREVLEAILSALPDNGDGSRVVVTSSIRSVVKGWSRGSYLYTMHGLSRAEMAELFRRTIEPHQEQLERERHRLPSPVVVLPEGLQALLDKCDGLPLPVIAAAQFLRDRPGTWRPPTDYDDEACGELAYALGGYLEDEQAFAGARSALARRCGGVSSYDEIMCMLSLTSYPSGHGISAKSLARRWVTEGLVLDHGKRKKDRLAAACRDKLIDLGVLEPLPRGSRGSYGSSRAKRCQVHGAVLEYLVQCSLSWNFSVLVQDQDGRRPPVGTAASSCGSVRRVAIHAGDDEDGGGIRSAAQELGDLSLVRSLTVRKRNTSSSHRGVRMSSESGGAGGGHLMSLLKKCRLLRVLDLEGCGCLGSDHLRAIFRLLHLRYLSLRSTTVVGGIPPRAIGRLHSLETLDLRDTKVDELPMDVLLLPQLAHLFGRFHLPMQLDDSKRATALEGFFASTSRLQTIAGFRIVSSRGRRGHELILRHARMLSKVKIWCEHDDDDSRIVSGTGGGRSSSTRWRPRSSNQVGHAVSPPDGSASSLLDGLVTPLKARLKRPLDSLWVDVGGRCSNFLYRVLDGSCTVGSIKLRGPIESLPHEQTLKSLRHVRELHLCNTGLPTEKLSELQNIVVLVYLKLAEDGDQGSWKGSRFVVNTRGFPSLQQLCFQGSSHLPALEFQPGSMQVLHSLQLICPDSRDLSATDMITNLPALDGIVLLHGDAAMEAWRQQALEHPRRPCVIMRQQ